MSTEAEALGERIAEMAAHLDAATHRLLTDLREYDRSGNWAQQGFADCARWLSWRVGWATGTARDHLRVADRLGDLPLIDDALRTGSVSYSKVRAMTRVATPANEALLVEDARHATGQQLELICRKYATVVRAAKQVDEDYDRQRRTVSRRDLEDGMVRIEATLHPEEAAVVWAALDRLARERCADESAELASRDATRTENVGAAKDSTADAAHVAPRGRFSRADALVDMAQGVVRGDAPRRSPIELVVTVAADVLHGRAPVGSGSAETHEAPVAAFSKGPHVSAIGHAPLAAFANVTCVSAGTVQPRAAGVGGARVLAAVREASSGLSADRDRVSPLVHAPLAVFADGTCVSAETARRLACDCGIVRVTEEESGNPLSVGRKTRSIPVSIARALLKRDPCCRFPGCGNRVYVEGHHIEHWVDGGETSLENLVNVCSFHHRFVHEYGYSVVLDEQQAPRFFDRGGSEVLDVPERPRPERLGWATVIDLNAALAIDATTGECLWDGDQPDFVDAIDALVRVDGLQ